MRQGTWQTFAARGSGLPVRSQGAAMAARITMKRKRKPRAKNKIEVSVEGSLVEAEPAHYSEAPRVAVPSTALVVRRSTVITSELEEVIDLIARERVYRAMLAGLGRRLLIAPPSDDRDGPGRR
jgi:hypothetical protein